MWQRANFLPNPFPLLPEYIARLHFASSLRVVVVMYLSSSQWSVSRNDAMSFLRLTHRNIPCLILHLLSLSRA